MNTNNAHNHEKNQGQEIKFVSIQRKLLRRINFPCGC